MTPWKSVFAFCSSVGSFWAMEIKLQLFKNWIFGLCTGRSRIIWTWDAVLVQQERHQTKVGQTSVFESSIFSIFSLWFYTNLCWIEAAEKFNKNFVTDECQTDSNYLKHLTLQARDSMHSLSNAFQYISVGHLETWSVKMVQNTVESLDPLCPQGVATIQVNRPLFLFLLIIFRCKRCKIVALDKFYTTWVKILNIW